VRKKLAVRIRTHGLGFDAALGQMGRTVVVNCTGCAAGMARPAVAMALEHDTLPEKMITVFAGNDRDATARAREYFVGYRPSSPSIALLKDGQVVKMLERWNIEGRHAHDIAAELTTAFDEHCAKTAAVQ
jgi:putative YphP/YqiW family bacilliredoxin